MNAISLIGVLALFGFLGWGVYWLLVRIGFNREEWKQEKARRNVETKEQIQGIANTLASPLFWIGLVAALLYAGNTPEPTGVPHKDPAIGAEFGERPFPNRNWNLIGFVGIVVGVAYCVRETYRWVSSSPRKPVLHVVKNEPGSMVAGVVYAAICLWLFAI